jgi:hypothetical protein
MWVEEAVAGDAPEAGPRHQAIAVAEDVPFHLLPMAGPSAHLAAELPVEGLEGLPLGLELVGVPFDELRSELRVHRHEVHCGSVSRLG